MTAQKVLIPACVVLVATGVWWLVHGEERGAAIFSFVIAALALGSLPVYRAVYRRLPRRVVRGTVSLRADGATALGRAREALRVLAPESQVEADPARSTASIEVPGGWRTFGERVSAVVHPNEGGSTVEVTSECVFRQLVDHGKNRANVDAVMRTLASFRAEE